LYRHKEKSLREIVDEQDERARNREKIHKYSQTTLEIGGA
jgi:hypothetical protein